MPPSHLETLARLSGESIWAIDPDRVSPQASSPVGEPVRTIAVVRLQGPLTPKSRSGWFADTIGMDRVQSALLAASNNADVHAIVLDVDSPGGTVAATPETAAVVREVAAKKRVIAVVDTLAASAAYWIASQASEIVMSPSSDVGSIGVLMVHWDSSKFLESMGEKVSIIRAGEFKAEGNPYEPLSVEARAHYQAMVDESYAAFVKDVATGRRVTQATVRDNYGQGRTVGADKAVKLGMADRIGTMRDVLAGLVQPASPRRRRTSFAF